MESDMTLQGGARVVTLTPLPSASPHLLSPPPTHRQAWREAGRHGNLCWHPDRSSLGSLHVHGFVPHSHEPHPSHGKGTCEGF